MMFLSVASCIILAVFATSCHGMSAKHEQVAGLPYNNIREKRSLKAVLEGVKALKKLLAGSTHVKSQSAIYRKYEKAGDINTAYQDFYSVGPATVSSAKYRGTTKVHGIVGDRELLLRDPRNTGKAVFIDIIDVKSKRGLRPGEPKSAARYVDRITYVKKRKGKAP